MVKHFFITGKIGVGKSTLLKNCINPYLDLFSGFYIQRVFCEEKLIGFRLCDIRKNDNFRFNSTNKYKDLFIYMDKQGEWNINELLFQEQFMSATKPGPYKLILLDEIGGFEVRNDIIMERLFSLLESSKPILGVLKAGESKKKMKGIIGMEQEKSLELQNYEKIINHRNITVHNLNKENYTEIKEKLELWLEENCE